MTSRSAIIARARRTRVLGTILQCREVNNRDKPLSFHYRASDLDLCHLGLPPPKSRKHEVTRQSIVLDLTMEGLGDDGATSYSRRSNWWSETCRYRGSDYTYRTVVRTVDDLAAGGWIEHWKAPPGPSGGRQSTMRATDALMLAVTPTAFEYVVHETVRLRDEHKHLAGYRDSDRTLRWRKLLAEINEALGALDVTLPGAEPVGLYGLRVPTSHGKYVNVFPRQNQAFRVFNEDFGHGGRIYGPWIQQLPKTWRQRLLIDGQPVAEPDYPEHHTRILYALQGEPLAGPAYDVPGFPRDLAKRALNTLYNAPNYTSAWLAIAREVERHECADPDYNGPIGEAATATATTLITALKDRHPNIEAYFHSGIGTWLQYLDSVMAGRVVLALQHRHGVVALPVHDSFVVPAQHESLTREAMAEAFNFVVRRAAA